jgi:hypothetical protein
VTSIAGRDSSFARINPGLGYAFMALRAVSEPVRKPDRDSPLNWLRKNHTSITRAIRPRPAGLWSWSDLVLASKANLRLPRVLEQL